LRSSYLPAVSRAISCGWARRFYPAWRCTAKFFSRPVHLKASLTPAEIERNQLLDDSGFSEGGTIMVRFFKTRFRDKKSLRAARPAGGSVRLALEALEIR
jgi:hypothetical protein